MTRVVVFAYHDVGCMGIRTLKRLGIDVARVYTHEDDPGEKHWFGSVRKTCAEEGFVCTTANPHLPEELAAIAKIGPDAIFSLYYRDMLKDSVLRCAKHGSFNLHGSLLPRYRGRAPVNWQILHGETQGGVTLHHMVKRADAGDIVDQEAFDIGPNDTGVMVYENMLPAAELVLRRSVYAVLDGSSPRIRQMESKATYYGRRRPEDGLIDWNWCAEDVRNLVRAVTKPYPGAFTLVGSKPLMVWWAQHQGPPGEDDQDDCRVYAPRDAVPGQVIARGGYHVKCGDRRDVPLLCLVRVEFDGREGDPWTFPELLRDGLILGGG